MRTPEQFDYQALPEFIADPNERLRTIFLRISKLDEYLDMQGIEQNINITDRDKTTSFWDFLEQERAYFDLFNGRLFEYLAVEATDHTEIMSGLIFNSLNYCVGLNEKDSIITDLMISCFDTTESESLYICLTPGDEIRLMHQYSGYGKSN